MQCAGTAEAASNAETTMTQLVQEYTIRAQVRALCNQSDVRTDRTEHVANSLGHLAAVVDQLNTLESSGIKVHIITMLYNTIYTMYMNMNCHVLL